MSTDSSPQIPTLNVPVCPVCNLAVPLERAKVDEHGRGIHEDCYLLTLKLKQETSGQHKGK